MEVIKIGAIWCSGCLIMKPRWKEIEEKYPNLKTSYIDYDESPKEIEKYQINDTNLPVCIFIDKNGKEITRKSGEISKQELINLIEEHIYM